MNPANHSTTEHDVTGPEARSVAAQPDLQRRIMRHGETVELYLTATPSRAGGATQQSRHLFTPIRRELHRADARIFCERIFAAQDAMPAIAAVRAEVYGDLNDGVPPTWLIVDPGDRAGLIGVQVHAIASPTPPVPMRCCNLLEGMAARLVQRGDERWLFVNGLGTDPLMRAGQNGSSDPVDPDEQARRMFFCAGCFLRQAGATMQSVARTWLWLGDVCAWYNELNQVRRMFFEREGLIEPGVAVHHLPASTGIGIHPAGGAACAMDLIALPGREDQIRCFEAAGHQKSAFEYGSAFSRAALAPMPAGDTLFISGTAAIDARGDTEHVGMIEAQIDDTLRHVRALLTDQNCDDRHVLTALVYCKNEQVQRVFRQRFADIAWPHITMIGEICRPELLFEIEVTASAAARI